MTTDRWRSPATSATAACGWPRHQAPPFRPPRSATAEPDARPERPRPRGRPRQRSRVGRDRRPDARFRGWWSPRRAPSDRPRPEPQCPRPRPRSRGSLLLGRPRRPAARRHDLDTGALQSARGVAPLGRVASDRHGGAWFATPSTLRRLDAAGNMVESVGDGHPTVCSTISTISPRTKSTSFTRKQSHRATTLLETLKEQDNEYSERHLVNRHPVNPLYSSLRRPRI
jgi:hypothetical protein